MTKRQLWLSVVIVCLSLFSVVVVFGGNSSNVQEESIYQSSSITCPKLYQEYWRCCQSWTRSVPLGANGPIWASATTWVMNRDIYDMPGTGDVMAHTNYVIGANYYENFWRGGQGWVKCVGPYCSGQWTGPYSLNGLPGTGDIQCLDCTVVENYLHQSFWRNNVGYYRKVPIVNGQPDWSSASSWTVIHFDDEGMPEGSGDMQSLGGFVWNGVFYQGFWRGDDGFARTVPTSGGDILWDYASGWSDPPDSLNNYPGCGSMQAQHEYIGHSFPPWYPWQ